MSKYIDADDAVERLGAYLMADAQIEYCGLASENVEDWKELADDILKGSPSIDIVRCQDCKYWVYNFNGCSRNPCTEPWLATDFCNYGERRADD